MNLESFEAELRLNPFQLMMLQMHFGQTFLLQTELAQRFLAIQKGKGSASHAS